MNPLHNPDLIRDFPTLLREDGVRVEILCRHGVGHPSQALSNPARWKEWMGVHGCDGCCSLAAFHLAELAHIQSRSDEARGAAAPAQAPECAPVVNNEGDASVTSKTAAIEKGP